MTDRFVEWDAAYVLGALGPAERTEYEQHLGECDRCRAEVAELAGIPGLLGHVPLPQVLALDVAPVQEHTIDADAAVTHLDERRESSTSSRGAPAVRRHRWRTPIAAALLLATGATCGVGINYLADESRGAFVATAPVSRWAFSAVRATTITAVVDVTAQPGGTLVQLECQYAGAADYGTSAGQPTLSMWVVDRSGTAVRAAVWQVKRDQVMRPVGRVATKTSDIAEVEIREGADGAVLMSSLAPKPVSAGT